MFQVLGKTDIKKIFAWHTKMNKVLEEKKKTEKESDDDNVDEADDGIVLLI